MLTWRASPHREHDCIQHAAIAVEKRDPMPSRPMSPHGEIHGRAQIVPAQHPADTRPGHVRIEEEFLPLDGNVRVERDDGASHGIPDGASSDRYLGLSSSGTRLLSARSTSRVNRMQSMLVPSFWIALLISSCALAIALVGH